MSRSVMIPVTRAPSPVPRTTTTAPTCSLRMSLAASIKGAPSGTLAMRRLHRDPIFTEALRPFVRAH
jgi:hypothetical protein